MISLYPDPRSSRRVQPCSLGETWPFSRHRHSRTDTLKQGVERAAADVVAGEVASREPRRGSPIGVSLALISRSDERLKIGSPGRTRTCDQSVTSFPAFLPGSDYLITRLTHQVRVSGACEVLLDWVPQPLVSARSCLPKTLRQASLRIPFPSSPRTRGRLP